MKKIKVINTDYPNLHKGILNEVIDIDKINSEGILFNGSRLFYYKNKYKIINSSIKKKRRYKNR